MAVASASVSRVPGRSLARRTDSSQPAPSFTGRRRRPRPYWPNVRTRRRPCPRKVPRRARRLPAGARPETWVHPSLGRAGRYCGRYQASSLRERITPLRALRASGRRPRLSSWLLRETASFQAPRGPKTPTDSVRQPHAPSANVRVLFPVNAQRLHFRVLQSPRVGPRN